jgi:ABC-2 type transport system permease protein
VYPRQGRITVPRPWTQLIGSRHFSSYHPADSKPPTRQVAQVVLLRLRRAPRRLTFLFTITFSLGLALGPVAVKMEHPMALVSVVCALFVPWLAGAAFGLNPLGDKGTVLPSTLTASVSGRQFVWGIMLPGLLYGLPLTVVSTLVTSVFSPYTIAEQIGLVILGAVLLVVTVALVPAIGMRFPRFSALTVGQSREIVSPSLTAVATYVFLTGGLSGIAVLLLLSPRWYRGYSHSLGGGVVCSLRP